MYMYLCTLSDPNICSLAIYWYQGSIIYLTLRRQELFQGLREYRIKFLHPVDTDSINTSDVHLNWCPYAPLKLKLKDNWHHLISTSNSYSSNSYDREDDRCIATYWRNKNQQNPQSKQQQNNRITKANIHAIPLNSARHHRPQSYQVSVTRTPQHQPRQQCRILQ